MVPVGTGGLREREAAGRSSLMGSNLQFPPPVSHAVNRLRNLGGTACLWYLGVRYRAILPVWHKKEKEKTG